MIAVTRPVLTHYGDIIARLTGLSRLWIGLLATATSLPERFTNLSAVTIAAAPNIAVGERARRPHLRQSGDPGGARCAQS
jgi:cation:H+ antiporter